MKSLALLVLTFLAVDADIGLKAEPCLDQATKAAIAFVKRTEGIPSINAKGQGRQTSLVDASTNRTLYSLSMVRPSPKEKQMTQFAFISNKRNAVVVHVDQNRDCYIKRIKPWLD